MLQPVDSIKVRIGTTEDNKPVVGFLVEGVEFTMEPAEAAKFAGMIQSCVASIWGLELWNVVQAQSRPTLDENIKAS